MIGLRIAPPVEPILVPLTSPKDLFEVWFGAAAANKVQGLSIVGNFRLHVELNVPDSRMYAARLVKKLFDGLICSMHSDRQPDRKATGRLAETYNVDEQIILERLSEPSNPSVVIPNTHRVVSPYRNNVKWNPADDRCMEGTLILRRASQKLARVYVCPMD